jgi:hypothetical protein
MVRSHAHPPSVLSQIGCVPGLRVTMFHERTRIFSFDPMRTHPQCYFKLGAFLICVSLCSTKELEFSVLIPCVPTVIAENCYKKEVHGSIPCHPTVLKNLDRLRNGANRAFTLRNVGHPRDECCKDLFYIRKKPPII